MHEGEISWQTGFDPPGEEFDAAAEDSSSLVPEVSWQTGFDPPGWEFDAAAEDSGQALFSLVALSKSLRRPWCVGRYTHSKLFSAQNLHFSPGGPGSHLRCWLRHVSHDLRSAGSSAAFDFTLSRALAITAATSSREGFFASARMLSLRLGVAHCCSFDAGVGRGLRFGVSGSFPPPDWMASCMTACFCGAADLPVPGSISLLPRSELRPFPWIACDGCSVERGEVGLCRSAGTRSINLPRPASLPCPASFLFSSFPRWAGAGMTISETGGGISVCGRANAFP